MSLVPVCVMLDRILIIFVVMAAVCVALPTTSMDDSSNDIDHEDEVAEFRAKYAAQMKSFMNFSVQPCDDFYEYACGNWKHRVIDRQCDKKRQNFLDIDYHLYDLAKEILKLPDINYVDPAYNIEFEKAKNYYTACLESELIPSHKSLEYLDILKSIGGFPAVDSAWNASEFSWFNMSAHMSNYEVMGFVNEQIDSETFLPFFPLPTYGFDIDLHPDNMRDNSSNAFQLNEKRMRDILKLYEVEDEKIEPVVEGIFAFFHAVMNMLEKFGESQLKCELLNSTLDSSANATLYRQFETYFEIAWEAKFQNTDPNNMPCIYFYHELAKICEGHKEAVANYLSLKFIYHMDTRLKDRKYQEDYCIMEVKSSMIYLFDLIFMKTYFSQSIADDVKSMAKEIRQSLRASLESVEWWEEETRKAALMKESSMRVNVGRYQDEPLYKALLEQLRELPAANEKYDINRINLKKFNARMKRFYRLHPEHITNHSKPLLLLQAMTSNAFFYLTDNCMYIPGGVLQPPLYHKDWPSCMKYGALGYTLGHELGHSYDALGRYYDHQGKRNYWWTEKDTKLVEERTNCIIDHYSNLTVTEINRQMDGKLTKSETIADVSGLSIALTTYRRQLKADLINYDTPSGRTKAEQMPGLDLTPDQLFFLTSAQMWCAAYKEANYWEEITDEHPFDKYRVLGLMSNNKDFAQAYNCPVGSRMNPREQKCEMW